MPEFYMTLLDFDPGSNFLLNGDMEANSYWATSGDVCSFWYDSNIPYNGGRSLAFQVGGSEPITDIASYTQSRVYDEGYGGLDSYGCQYLFDGIYTTSFSSSWVVAYPNSVEWFQVKFNNPISIQRAHVLQRTESLYSGGAKQLRFWGSNVGSFMGEQIALSPNFVVDTVIIQHWDVYTMTNVEPINFLRCVCVPKGSTWMFIAEVEFYEW